MKTFDIMRFWVISLREASFAIYVVVNYMYFNNKMLNSKNIFCYLIFN